jgi:hypothetical protein
MFARTVPISAFAFSLILHGFVSPSIMPLQQQRDVIEYIHHMFPRPLPYLDRSSMLASFPQVGFFMTTWGLEDYLARRQPVLRRAIDERQPPLLIANHPLLDVEGAVYPANSASPAGLLKADRDALAESYVHYWGPVYIAGKHLGDLATAGARRFELHIGGSYRLDTSAPVKLDGAIVHPGDIVRLERGLHWITSLGGTGPVTLRWSTVTFWPEKPPPSLELFLGF